MTTPGSNPIIDYDGDDELEDLAPRGQVVPDEELPDFEIPDLDSLEEDGFDEPLPDEAEVDLDDAATASDESESSDDDWSFVIDDEEDSEQAGDDGDFGFKPMSEDAEVEGWSELSAPSSEDDEAFDAFEDMSDDEVKQRMADESEAPDWEDEVARAKADEGEELDLDDLEDDEGEEPKKRDGDGRSKLSDNPVVKAYLAFAEILVKVLCFPLAILGKLPIIGKFARIGTTPLATILRKIKVVLPVLLIVGVFVMSNMLTVPKSVKTELPDDGAVVMSDFKAEGATVSAQLTNEGETIGYVTPTFYVHKTTFHPFTWLKPVRYLKCVGEPMEVDIDSSIAAKAACSEAVDGFGKRVSGEVND